MAKPLRVIGIDPAPSKGLHVYDECGYRHYPVRSNGTNKSDTAAMFMDELARTENVLICWDAPLTGPPEAIVHKPRTDTAAGAVFEGNSNVNVYSRRAMEAFYAKKGENKPPKGISVLPYAGCPHWTISRALLGLPRVGRWDCAADSLPFTLITSNDPPEKPGRYVVEVHPALALWYWLKDSPGAPASWRYNGQSRNGDTPKETLRDLWEALVSVPSVRSILPDATVPTDTHFSDDYFDAFIAYALGRLWLERSDHVRMVGNADTGALLLPAIGKNGKSTGIPRGFDST